MLHFDGFSTRCIHKQTNPSPHPFKNENPHFYTKHTRFSAKTSIWSTSSSCSRIMRQIFVNGGLSTYARGKRKAHTSPPMNSHGCQGIQDLVGQKGAVNLDKYVRCRGRHGYHMSPALGRGSRKSLRRRLKGFGVELTRGLIHENRRRGFLQRVK